MEMGGHIRKGAGMTPREKEKARKIRALSDEDLLKYINNRVEKARAEEKNKWRRKHDNNPSSED